MTTAASKLRRNEDFTLLTEHNYPVWAKYRKATLKTEGWWTAVSAPDDLTSKQKGEDVDGKAWGTLFNCLSYSVVQTLPDELDTAKELWDWLKERYANRNKSQVPYLLHDFSGLRPSRVGPGVQVPAAGGVRRQGQRLPCHGASHHGLADR